MIHLSASHQPHSDHQLAINYDVLQLDVSLMRLHLVEGKGSFVCSLLKRGVEKY